jgi:hypothetical protein
MHIYVPKSVEARVGIFHFAFFRSVAREISFSRHEKVGHCSEKLGFSPERDGIVFDYS